MSQTPEEIRMDIENTRRELSSDVNALTESARPGNIVRRRTAGLRGTATSAKERVMGAMPETSDLKDQAGGRVGDARGAVQAQTRGNPLAAGVIAFGVGWLASSLLPASQAEQKAAAKVKENVQPLADEAKAMAQETGERLREPARQAVDSVKETASEGVQHTKEEGVSSAQQVKSDAQDAAGEVRESRV